MGETPPDKKSMGPYAPPLPSEAEREENEPMASANDKMTPRDSFLPTSSSLDAYDAEIAKKWATVPPSAKAGREAVQESFTVGGRDAMGGQDKPETKEQERNPPGFSDVDEDGYKHLKTEDE